MEMTLNSSNLMRIRNKGKLDKLSKENSFAPFEIYLWIHGFVSIPKFQLGCKCITTLIIQVVMMLIFEVNMIYVAFVRFQKIYNGDSNRDYVFLTIVLLFEILLRIQLHVNRNKLKIFTRRTLKMYYILTSKSLLPFRYGISIILFFNDIIIILMSLMLLSKGKPLNFEYKGNNLNYGIIPFPYSTHAYRAGIIIGIWSFMTPFFAIYFCSFCFILKKILNELKKRIVDHKTDLHYICKNYHDVSSLISTLNQALHPMILVSFILLTGKTFYSCYILLFASNTRAFKIVFVALILLFSSLYFAAMCTFSSAVTNSALEVKDALCGLPINMNRVGETLQFFNKINTDAMGFKILDSLAINRSMILTTIGNLVTYGILIATFNLNSNK